MVKKRKGRRWIARLRRRLGHGLFLGLLGIFRLIGVRNASAFGGWLGRRLMPRYNDMDVLRRNLDIALPDRDRSDDERLIGAISESHGREFAESLCMPSYSGERGKHRLSLVGLDRFLDAHARGKGVVLAGPHMASSTIASVALRNTGTYGGLMVKTRGDKFHDDWLTRQRDLYASQAQLKRGGNDAIRARKLLKQGHYLMIAIDQAVEGGLVLPFFGQPALTTPLPAALALWQDSPILPVMTRRLEHEHIELTFLEPITIVRTGDRDKDIEAITNELNRVTEQMIRDNPEQWIWFYDRWRLDRA